LFGPIPTPTTLYCDNQATIHLATDNNYHTRMKHIDIHFYFIQHVMVSPSPQPKEEENDKLHELRRYARDFRRQHTTDAERFDWGSDDEDYGLAIGCLVVT
jgi:hypothetical protein